MEERYLDDNYVVNDNGEVFRVLANCSRKKRIPELHNGYERIKIYNKTYRVHRLVMKLFKGESDLTVDHINGIKHDNRLCNLQYVTTEENTRLYWERNKLARLIDNKNKLLIKLNKINKEISEEVLKNKNIFP